MGVGALRRRLNGNSGRVVEGTKALEMGRKFTEGDSEKGPAGGGYSRSKVLDSEKHVASSGIANIETCRNPRRHSMRSHK